MPLIDVMYRKWVLTMDLEYETEGLVSEYLKTLTMRCIRAESYSDATKKLQNQRFWLVVMGIASDNSPGHKVIDFIRQDRGNLNLNFVTPIMVITGPINHDALTRFKAKVQTVMIKPVDGKVLVNRLRRLVENEQAARLNSVPQPSPENENRSLGDQLIVDLIDLFANLETKIAELRESLKSYGATSVLAGVLDEIEISINKSYLKVNELRRIQTVEL